jgi:hypothetical protein
MGLKKLFHKLSTFKFERGSVFKTNLVKRRNGLKMRGLAKLSGNKEALIFIQVLLELCRWK